MIGTRPEALKLVPVYFALRDQYDVQVVSTGQHKEMLSEIFDLFGIKPHVELKAMAHKQSLPQITGKLFSVLNDVVEGSRAQLVIVQGDTTTAMVAAMIGYYHKVPVAHVEAGLRSHQKYAPFPEEINRSIISLVADLNFAPTAKAAENLAGYPNVYVVGNTILDCLRLTLGRIQNLKASGELEELIRDERRLILVTAHRRESFGTGLENICLAVRTLSAKYPQLRFVFPVHPNPHVREKVRLVLADQPSVSLTEPLRYDEMVRLMAKAYIILTDSGGIQEEAPSLQVPLSVMRDVTERPEGIEAGCAVLGGTATESIVSAFDRIYENPDLHTAMKNAASPYGDGQSAQRIATIINTFL